MTVVPPTAPARELGRLVPGLALAFGAAALLEGIAPWLPSGVSPLLPAIVVGALAANLGWLPEATGAGLAVAGRRVLRVGIVLLGLQLAVRNVLALGWPIIVGAVVIVVSGLTTAVAGGRLLRMSPTQSLLIGCGVSICGAAAVAGADGIVEEHDEAETVTAVALVVLYGTTMIALVPALAAGAGLSARQAGVLAGGSVHEVAQVVAVGGALAGAGPTALTTAVLVKLTRVLLLAPVLFGLSTLQRRSADRVGPAGRRPPLVPLFVAGFIGAVALRSTGTVPAGVVETSKAVEAFLLTAAMFALGRSVRFATLRRAGWRPLGLGAACTAVVTAVAFGVAAST